MEMEKGSLQPVAVKRGVDAESPYRVFLPLFRGNFWALVSLTGAGGSKTGTGVKGGSSETVAHLDWLLLATLGWLGRAGAPGGPQELVAFPTPVVQWWPSAHRQEV